MVSLCGSEAAVVIHVVIFHLHPDAPVRHLSDLSFTILSVSGSSVEEFFLARGPSSSAEVRGLVIHDIKEVEGVRQQEEQEDKGDEEIRDEVNGEVEEITQRAHET